MLWPQSSVLQSHSANVFCCCCCRCCCCCYWLMKVADSRRRHRRRKLDSVLLRCPEVPPLLPRRVLRQSWENLPRGLELTLEILMPPELFDRVRWKQLSFGSRLRGFSGGLEGCTKEQTSFGKFHSWMVYHLKIEIERVISFSLARHLDSHDNFNH